MKGRFQSNKLGTMCMPDITCTDSVKGQHCWCLSNFINSLFHTVFVTLISFQYGVFVTLISFQCGVFQFITYMYLCTLIYRIEWYLCDVNCPRRWRSSMHNLTRPKYTLSVVAFN